MTPSPGKSQPFANARAASAVTVLLLASQYALADGTQTQQGAVGHQAKLIHLAAEHPISMGAGLTIVGQGMKGDTDDAGLTYSVDLAFEADFGAKGSAFIYINTAQGAGIDTGAQTGPNGDNEFGTLDVDGKGFSETRVAEAWYRIPLTSTTELTLGKIDPTGIYDGNEVANDETSQFLADAFINNPAIAFPGYTAGASLAFNPRETIAVNVGLFEASAEFDGSLASAFVIGEVALSRPWHGHDGNIRLIAWTEDVSDNDGFAISANQALGDRVTLFARLGKQDERQNFDYAYSLGGQWAMGGNIFGAAYSALSTTALAGPEDEGQTELYYRHTISDNVHVTADLQYVSNPGFSATAKDVWIYGLRAQVDL